MIVPVRAALAAACQRELAANRVNRFLHVASGPRRRRPGSCRSSRPTTRRRGAAVGAARRALLPVALGTAARTELGPRRGGRVPAALRAAGAALGLAARQGRRRHRRPDRPRRCCWSCRPRWSAASDARRSPAWPPRPGGVTLALAAVGLAVGFWVRDPVRGLLDRTGRLVRAALRHRPAAARVVRRAVDARAPAAVGGAAHGQPARRLPDHRALQRRARRVRRARRRRPGGWWLAHGWAWLALVVGLWTIAGFTSGLAGARRRLDA